MISFPFHFRFWVCLFSGLFIPDQQVIRSDVQIYLFSCPFPNILCSIQNFTQSFVKMHSLVCCHLAFFRIVFTRSSNQNIRSATYTYFTVPPKEFTQKSRVQFIANFSKICENQEIWSATNIFLAPPNHLFIRDKVFKNGPSKKCERQPLENSKSYGLPKQTISLQIF